MKFHKTFEDVLEYFSKKFWKQYYKITKKFHKIWEKTPVVVRRHCKLWKSLANLMKIFGKYSK